jgi:hypothetical protein
MDDRAFDDSCRLTAALVADIGETHAAIWLITSAVLLAAVLAVSDQSPRLWPLSWSPSAWAALLCLMLDSTAYISTVKIELLSFSET